MRGEKQNRIWISWEPHRRTLELSEAFNAKLFVIDIKGRPFYSYILSVYKTFQVIRKERPKILFVQNPSMVLAAFTCFIRPIFRYRLVVDRHSNFKFEFRKSKNIKWMIFQYLSKYTVKKANLTIVTNKYLRLIVSKMGGEAAILPDKLPKIPLEKVVLDIETPYSALFICTFSSDEPYKNVFEAAKEIPELTIYVTGNYEKALSKIDIEQLPKNVKLLGFVSDSDYFRFLNSADFTIVLTSQEFTLNCGAYESVATGKPMVLSGTNTIRNYFTEGAVYVDSSNFDSNSIYSALSEMLRSLEKHEQKVDLLSNSISVKWQEKFLLVEKTL